MARQSQQFDGAAEIDKTVSELTGMQLMWAFYGYSKTYAIIIGCFEIIGGLLILFKRTRVIGCLVVTTILVNVILQDFFYEVNYGAFKAAMIYQSIILILLWLNKKPLFAAINELLRKSGTRQSIKNTLLKLLMAFVLFAVLRVTEFYFTH